MKRLLLLLTLACTTAFAAEPTLVVPQFAKKPGEPADGDPLKAKYDAAWAKYANAVGNATAVVNKALDAQFERAADAGNLELADMWDKKKKFFLDTKTIEWPSDGKAKVEWRKANPSVDFPDDFSEVVESAQQAYAAAVDALKADYEELVKEYTKARNLDRAKQVREEMAALDKKPSDTLARPKMVEESAVKSKTTKIREQTAPDARRIGVHYYKVFFLRDITWDNAQAQCKKMGGYLAIMNTPDERIAVGRLKGAGTIEKPGPITWLGGFQKPDGSFWWTDGTPVKELATQRPENLFVAFTIGDDYNPRPINGRKPAAVPFVEGFICEWDE